jgi:hypothetical protein
MLSEASRIFFSNSREKNGLNAADRLRKYLAPFGVARATMRGRRSQLSLRVRGCQKLNRVEDAAAPECRLGHPPGACHRVYIVCHRANATLSSRMRAPAPLILAVGDPFGICWIGEERWAY